LKNQLDAPSTDQPSVGGHEPLVHADHQVTLGFLGRGDHLPGLGAGGGHGLFDQHVQTTLERRDGLRGVQGVGRGHDHGVQVGLVEHLLPTGEGHAAETLGLLGRTPLHRVRDRGDHGVGVCGALGQVAALGDGTGADECVAGGLFSGHGDCA